MNVYVNTKDLRAREALAVLVCLLGVHTAACDVVKKKLGTEGKDAGAATPNSEATAAGATPGGSAPSAGSASGCELPAQISKDRTLKAGCVVEVRELVRVVEGAVLTISPGVSLRFHAGTRLLVDSGGVVARGSEQAPILFTSAAKTKAPGDWDGVELSGAISAGTHFEHVVIEYAGKKGAIQAALSIEGDAAAGRIAVVKSTFRHNEGGVWNHGRDARFVKFEGNTLTHNGFSLHAAAEVLGSVGTNQWGDPIRTGGHVRTTQTWPTVSVPIHVTETLVVGGNSSPAILTLADKTTLRFAMGVGIHVGVENGGGLIAKGVTMTSNNPQPKPGDWEGISLFDKATSVLVEGSVIEYAGHDSTNGAAAIVFVGAKPNQVRVTKTHFKHMAKPIFGGLDAACPSWADPKLENKADGQPFCPKPE